MCSCHLVHISTIYFIFTIDHTRLILPIVIKHRSATLLLIIYVSFKNEHKCINYVAIYLAIYLLNDAFFHRRWSFFGIA